MSEMNDESTATVIITFHFCLIITSGVLSTLQHSLRIVWLMVQVLFVVWGSFLCLSCLLGCVRLLRSLIKPLSIQVNPHHGTKMFVDPGAEVQLMPRIRITDENEQTFNLTASTSSLNTTDHQKVPSRSETYPMNSLPKSTFKPPKNREDCTVIRPLISFTLSPDEEATVQTPSPISYFEKRPINCIEKQLRKMTCTASIGVSLCLLKAYEILGPHAFIYSGHETVAVIPWFCFQSISRVVELLMAFIMATISQQALRRRHYFYPPYH